MIKIISFDLDGTLIKSTFADLVWLEGLPKIYAQEKGIDFNEAKCYLKGEYDKIGDNKKEWYDLEYWFNRFKLKTTWILLLQKYRYAVETFPEVPTILEKLYNKYNLILISNAKREFIDIELEKSNLKQYFYLIFSSISDFNMVKKVSDFYSMICNRIGVNPDQIIHIGDHKEFDYKIPKKLGIKSFYLDRNRSSKGKFVVYDLQEFFSKVENFYSFH